MSFQDLQNDVKPPSSGRGTSSSQSQNPSPFQSQSLAAEIFQINTAVAGFRRLVDAVGTSKDTPDHRHKLHNTRQQIVRLVKATSAKLKTISESDRSVNVHPSKRIEDAKLAKDFQTTLQEFQKIQQLASERESTYSPFVQPSSETTGILEPSMDQEEQPFLMEQKRQEVLRLDDEIAFNEAIMEEREQGIIDVQDQIGQANEMFKDLAVLVHEQGVVIDDIQSNIEASSGATTQARVQFSRASKNLKSKCSWCWWVLAIVIVVMVIILLILII